MTYLSNHQLKVILLLLNLRSALINKAIARRKKLLAARKKLTISIEIIEVLSINETAAKIRHITPIPAEIHARRVNVLIFSNLYLY